MLKYNVLIAYRNFKKHKANFAINIVGLTAAFTGAFFITLWVQDEFSIDKFHEKDEQLYQVMALQSYSGEKSVSDGTPGLLGQSLKADFPDIQYATTTTWIYPALLSYENTFLRENGYHAGKDFFNVFTYPLIIGNTNEVLNNNTSICISRRLAENFFGGAENAMGKTISYGETQDFTVSGVFENINKKSTYIFDFVLPLEAFLEQAPWASDWANSGPLTYLVLHEGTNAQEASEKISKYIKSKGAANNQEFFLKRYSEQYLKGNYTNGVSDGGRIDYVRLFAIIAILIIVIACINFMNLSTAQASKRGLEVGIRKTAGAKRGGLIRQYIVEAMLISLASMILCYILVVVLLSPFNAITDKTIELSFSPIMIGVSIATIFVTGIIAGSYPAFYLTHFRPIEVLNNEIKNSIGEVWARKGLVIFQFTITIVLIVGVVVIHRQTQYLNKKHLGYNRDNVIFFSQDGDISNRRNVFLNELRNIPGVVSAGSTSHGLLGQVSSNPGVEWSGKEPEEQVVFERFFVDHEFYETMKFEMAKGRWFSREFSTDSTKLVINQAAAKAMGFSADEAIGQNIQLSKNFNFEVIGILKDFHYTSLHEPVAPAYFRIAGTGNVAARLEGGREIATLEGIKALYQQFAPGFIFDYAFLDKNYQALYTSEKRVGTLSSYFASLAIIISCLGLFGLAAFTAERRFKEIGIRKVLGASTSNIVLMISKDFIGILLVSIAISVPISYFFMKDWLAQFAYQINLSAWIFLSAAMISILIALFTVASQALKAAHANPVKSLRNE